MCHQIPMSIRNHDDNRHTLYLQYKLPIWFEIRACVRWLFTFCELLLKIFLNHHSSLPFKRYQFKPTKNVFDGEKRHYKEFLQLSIPFRQREGRKPELNELNWTARNIYNRTMKVFGVKTNRMSLWEFSLPRVPEIVWMTLLEAPFRSSIYLNKSSNVKWDLINMPLL